MPRRKKDLLVPVPIPNGVFADRLDSFVGHWVKNVPYYLVSRARDNKELDEVWRKAGRRYLVPFPLIRSLGWKRLNLLTQGAVPAECETVIDYFGFYSLYDDWVVDVGTLRINGRSAGFPERSKIPPNIHDVYEFLDLDPNAPLQVEITNETGPVDVLSPPRGSERFDPKAYDIKKNVTRTLHALAQGDAIVSLEQSRKKELCIVRIPNDFDVYGTQFVLHVTDAYKTVEMAGRTTEHNRMLWTYFSNRCVLESKLRWTIIPVNLAYGTLRIGEQPTGLATASHANILLIDNVRREVYLFDPHGQGSHDDRAIIENVLVGVGLPQQLYGWRVRAREDWCPRLGGQALESVELGGIAGYCSVWSLWLLELLLKYPDVELSVLHKRALRNVSRLYDGDITRFIGEYAQRIAKAPEVKVQQPVFSSQPLLGLLFDSNGAIDEHTLKDGYAVYKINGGDLELWRQFVYASRGYCYYYDQFGVVLTYIGLGHPSNVDGVNFLLYGGKQAMFTATFDRAQRAFITVLTEIHKAYEKLLSLLNDAVVARLFPNVTIVPLQQFPSVAPRP